MNDYAPRRLAAGLLRSPRLGRAFSVTSLLVAFCTPAIRQTAGRVTLTTILICLGALALAILLARRRAIRPLSIAPTTLLAFATWALISTMWSFNDAASLGGWVSLVGYGLLAVSIAIVRSQQSLMHDLADTLRILLVASLAVEVLAGVFGVTFSTLGVSGGLLDGGPLQGVFVTRNLLALVTVIALVTFIIEWRSATIARLTSLWSIALAAFLAVFSGSPTAVVLVTAVVLALVALRIVRGATPAARNVLQWVFGTLVVVGLVTAYLLRHPILRWLDITAGFSLRADLWNEILDWVRLRPVQGFGWRGVWASDDYPLYVINLLMKQSHASALNAFFDVLLQLGWVGLVLFLTLCTVAFVRAWRSASTHPSIAFALTPILLVTLLVDSMFESFTISEPGWLLLALCACRASLTSSWRERLVAAGPGETRSHPGSAG
ncbi:MAG: O-antigen ligase family protein [Microbacterium sp.]